MSRVHPPFMVCAWAMLCLGFTTALAQSPDSAITWFTILPSIGKSWSRSL